VGVNVVNNGYTVRAYFQSHTKYFDVDVDGVTLVDPNVEVEYEIASTMASLRSIVGATPGPLP
jgi:hypothetical protein